MIYKIFGITVLVALTVGGAWLFQNWSQVFPLEQPYVSPMGSEAAVESAKTETAKEAGVPLGEVMVLEVQVWDWPNSCLGLEKEEICLQVIVPGYLIKTKAKEQVYIWRTNGDGAVIRLEA